MDPRLDDADRGGVAGSPLRTGVGIDDDKGTFEKIVRLTTPADITGVWVAGNPVVGVD